ncbi:MAG: fumarate hydratase C-terminal domain-containing protein [Oscillospiraceae bacterium]|nr:fumarate hydratase C-terminal domain-containing protein [Oscillospiraceae bacterium]
MEYHCNVSDLPAMVREQQLLHAGDRVIMSGTVYTSRDAAHKRLTAAMRTDGVQALPFPLKDAVIYYAGPTAAPPGRPIGACGPTTSGRMDPYAPMLLDAGLLAMIGKGERSQAVCEAIYAATGHGATVLEGEGSYEHCARNVVYSVVSSAQAKKVVRCVKETDPGAFVNEVKTQKLSGYFVQPKEE